MTRAASVIAPAPSLELRFSWPLIIAAAVFAYLIQQPTLLNDPDTYWHIKVGEWILSNGAIPSADHFSHTMRGTPWQAHEWLGELLFAAAYAAGGWTAVVICTSAAFAGALAILARYLLRFLEPIYMLGAVALAYGLLAPHLLARPHVLMMPLIVLWGIGLMNAHDERRLPSLAMLPLMTLWANLHGAFIFGLLLVPLFAAEAVICAKGRRWHIALRWSAFFAACAGAATVTPFGVDGLTYAFKVNEMTFALSLIAEWRSPDFQKLHPLELCLLIVAAAVLARGLRLSWLRIGLLLGLLHLALKHARHADLMALLGPLVLAKPIAEQWFNKTVDQGPTAAALDAWFRRLASPASPTAAGLVAILLALASSVALYSNKLHPREKFAPQAALHALQTKGVDGNGLNSYDFGGFLIFSGVPTFIDGRADVFGDRFLRSYVTSLNLSAPGGLEQLLEQHSIRWTLLSPGTPALEVLDRLPGWQRLHRDPVAVVHVRSSCPTSRSAPAPSQQPCMGDTSDPRERR